MKQSLLFFGKAGDNYSDRAIACCCDSFITTSFSGDWGDPFPTVARAWTGDYIISYLSRWIIPPSVLTKARIAAINFHSATPDYPGIGCINFALYDGATEYGVTCHHMAPKVDTGPIIAVSRFAVDPKDTVETVLSRSYTAQWELFRKIFKSMVAGNKLPESVEQWTRLPYTRIDLNRLSVIDGTMSILEGARRVRATTFRNWKPTFN